MSQIMAFAGNVESFCAVFFLGPSHGGVLLTAPQMKFIGIPTSLSLSQPLHHILFDKWCRSPEQIILFFCLECLMFHFHVFA